MTFVPHENGTAISSNGNGHVVALRKAMYGIFKKDSFIYTDKIGDIDTAWLYDWFKGKAAADPELIRKHHLHLYSGIADFNNIRLLRINDAASNGVRHRSPLDEIDLFWGMLKSRLIKIPRTKRKHVVPAREGD
jgi:hypothetical protein